jgi:hypothetical protein
VVTIEVTCIWSQSSKVFLRFDAASASCRHSSFLISVKAAEITGSRTSSSPDDGCID